MDNAHLQELAELEDTYWWHVAKRQLVVRLLQRYLPPPGRLVEGGIGSSRNLVTFRDIGYEVQGFDILEEAVRYGREKGIEDVHTHDLAEPWPVEPSTVRAVVLLDVLEHLADPVGVLRHAASALEEGGGIVLTVPAYPWLFGEWDRQLGHYCRYTAHALRQQAAEASLRVQWLSHWNSFSLPAAVAVRGFQRLVPRERSPVFPRVSYPVDKMFRACANFERTVLALRPIPLGLSLVGVLVK